MRAFSILLVMSLWLAPVGNAEEKPPPPNEPPQLWRASAMEQDGDVVVQIARPDYQAPRQAVAAEIMKWENLRTVTLGRTVHAYSADGKPVKSESVLKALAKPKGVAVFVRFYKSKSGELLEPDPFYLAMLREETLSLVVAAEDIDPLIPGP